MTDEEKILKFAGFIKRDKPHQKFGGWETPSGLTLWGGKSPDTTDPTTLFKWCVPKLRDLKRPGNYKLGSIHFHDNWNNEGGWLCEINMEQNVDRQSAEVWVTAKQGATPGTALRAAILSVVGEGE